MSDKRQSISTRSTPVTSGRASLSDSAFELDQLDIWHALEDVTPAACAVPQLLTMPALAPSPVVRRSAPAQRSEAKAPVETHRVTPASSPMAAIPGSSTVSFPWTPPVSQPTSVFPTPVRRRDVSEMRETLLPFVKWGAVVFMVILGGLGLTRISAGYRTIALPNTHSIEVRTLLGNKPMPGAAVTFTPVLSPEQTAELGDDLSAGLQWVGRGMVAADGTVSPALSPDKPGLPAGEYIVSLSWCKVEVKDGETVTGPDRVPQIFRTPSTSTLRLTVLAGKNPLTSLAIIKPKTRIKRASYDHE